jgi:hypothetical protein
VLSAINATGSPDPRVGRYLTALQGIPNLELAELQDMSFDTPARRVLVLWHEPSTWVTNASLNLYALDRELRRLAAVLPRVLPNAKGGPP